MDIETYLKLHPEAERYRGYISNSNDNPAESSAARQPKSFLMKCPWMT